MTHRDKDVIVVGGGIGGLAAALRLSQLGLTVRVLEQAAEFGEVGAGLQIAPNCTRILDELGLLDEVVSLGVLPDHMVMKDAVDGSELTRLDLRDLRDRGTSGDWSLASAVDPVNLAGIVTPGARVPALHKNALVIQNGRCIATKVGGRIEMLASTDPREQLLIRKSLQVGRKLHAPAEPRVPEPHVLRRGSKAPDNTQLHSRRRFGY